MAFRIKDLLISLVPAKGKEAAGHLGCLMSPCPENHGSIVAGDCTRCTDLGSCDAGCTRIQCSYQTKDLADALVEMRDAELLLLKAQLRLEVQGIERRRSAREIDTLEKHLEGALKELRAERARLGKSPKKLTKRIP